MSDVTKWVSEVSFANEMRAAQKKVEVRALGGELMSSLATIGVPSVKMIGSGGNIPVIVGMKSTVTKIEDKPDGTRRVLWEVTFWPEHLSLIQRLFAVSGVRYKIPPNLRSAHKHLTELLKPEYEGANVEMYFALIPGQKEPFRYWNIDSLAKMNRDVKKAEAQNMLIQNRFWHIPGPLLPWHLDKRRRYFEKTPHLHDVITIEKDPWDDIDDDEIHKLTETWFFPVLYSLWKSVFAQGKVAVVLQQEHGYQFHLADQTFLARTDIGIRDVFQCYRSRLQNLTMFGG